MAESTQHKLDRVRPPRVQITYDVEIGGAMQQKELPLVMGVFADLSAKSEKPLPRLKDRKFVEIDQDNINDVLAATEPRVAFPVDNRLSKDGTSMQVELRFRNMDDFEPVSVVRQVPPLKKLLDARSRLTDLLAKLDGNDDLDAKLQEIVANTDTLMKIKAATGETPNA
jgi:type VI secretion system protein ImpB